MKTDSRKLSATLFEGTGSNEVLVIASATGVKQSYYQKFAEFISKKNITVITFDYKGIGHSLNEPIKELTNNVTDWGKKDLESVLNYVIKNYPNSKKYFLGHSMGGQLLGLSKSSVILDKIIFVAAQSGFWKYWNGIDKVKMWANWNIIFPVMIQLFGYMPTSRISRMEDLPKNVAKQWSNWGREKEYLLSELPLEETVFEKLKQEITSFSIEDDIYAPKQAVEWLESKFCNARIKQVHLLPQDFNSNKIGHFGIFKDKFKENIWKLLLNEMRHIDTYEIDKIA